MILFLRLISSTGRFFSFLLGSPSLSEAFGEKMAGPEQQAANQLQVKRSAESEAQPAPVAKRPVTQEFEEKKDVQDGATVEPSPETNHVVSCWSLS